MLLLKVTRLAGLVDVHHHHCSHLVSRYFAKSSCASKKSSPYTSHDSDLYSSLVRSVLSPKKVSSRSPESLQAEDEQVYGPVVLAPFKTRTVAAPKTRKTPQILHPFQHDTITESTDDLESTLPLRIALNRDRRDKWANPSVSRILQYTLSPQQIFYLERWKREMIAKLGEKGFKEYSEKLFRQGKLFHTAVENILVEGETPSESPSEIEGYMESVSHVLKNIRSPRAIESAVQHGTLNYLGIVDCVARYKGVLCLIDWKTSEKPKPHLSNTYDNPIQVAAYAGALNSDTNYNFKVDKGLIVVGYKDGSPAHVHKLDEETMLKYWNKWLGRLGDFIEKRREEGEQIEGNSSNKSQVL